MYFTNKTGVLVFFFGDLEMKTGNIIRNKRMITNDIEPVRRPGG